MAGGIQVLRIETHPRLDGGLVKHVLGTNRPETACSVFPPVQLLQDRQEDARVLLAQFREARKGKRGRPPKEAVSIVIAGPPPYGDPEEFDYAREIQWAKDSLAWLPRLIGPNSMVAAAGLHRDETSPHVHVLVVPVTTTGRLTWCGVRDEAVPRMGRKHRKGKARYSHFQDDYQDQVGITYGLGRGNCGSLAKHEEIDRTRALERRNERSAREATRIANEKKDLQSNVVRLREQAESRRKAVEAEQQRQADLDEADKKRKKDRADDEARMAQLRDDAALAVKPGRFWSASLAEQGAKLREDIDARQETLDTNNRALSRQVKTLAGQVETLTTERDSARSVRKQQEHKISTLQESVESLKKNLSEQQTLRWKAASENVRLQRDLYQTTEDLESAHQEGKLQGWREFASRLADVAKSVDRTWAMTLLDHLPLKRLYGAIFRQHDPQLLEVEQTHQPQPHERDDLGVCAAGRLNRPGFPGG